MAQKCQKNHQNCSTKNLVELSTFSAPEVDFYACMRLVSRDAISDNDNIIHASSRHHRHVAPETNRPTPSALAAAMKMYQIGLGGRKRK